jgi:DNA-binding XRE family transcriptional regulator
VQVGGYPLDNLIGRARTAQFPKRIQQAKYRTNCAPPWGRLAMLASIRPDLDSDLNLRLLKESTPHDEHLATRRRAPNRAQVQPTTGPKWAFGKVLREYRERNGISQEQLAEAAGLDRSFISLVERGIQSPNIVVLLKLAEVLDVPAAELIAKMESAIRKPR